MATYGLTATGFVVKTFEVIRQEMQEKIWDTFGTSLDLSDRTPFGQLIAIFAERQANMWEVAQAAHAAMDPDSATGTALANIASISGTLRDAATKSTVTLHLTGTAATVIPIGNQVSVDATGEIFTTTESATLAAATAWASATAYAVGDIVSNDSNIYVCDVAGTSAGSGGPTGEGTAIVDNTVTWRSVGDGLAYDTAEAESVNTGAISANAYSITTLETAVAGWDSVQNLTDADVGSTLETDAELRIRREDEIASAGTGPRDALRADILSVTGVEACTVFVNNTDATDADGVPAHSVEILVRGGDDQDIADQIFASIGAATGTYGSSSATVTDSEGTDVTIYFSRPTEIDIWVEVTLTYDADLYPSDGDTQVETEIVTYGDAQDTGKDVVSSRIKAACFEVAGVLDVSLAYIGTSASPSTETTIAISLRELAAFDTSRITVTSSEATP